MSRCTECRGLLKPGHTEEVAEVSGRKYVKTIPAMVCGACKSAFPSGPDLQAFELEVALSVAHNGPSNGETFRYMRKALGIAATDLAQLLDVTPETVSRWENGKMPMDRKTWVALGGMVVDRVEGVERTRERLLASQLDAPATMKVVKLDATKHRLLPVFSSREDAAGKAEEAFSGVLVNGHIVGLLGERGDTIRAQTFEPRRFREFQSQKEAVNWVLAEVRKGDR